MSDSKAPTTRSNARRSNDASESKSPAIDSTSFSSTYYGIGSMSGVGKGSTNGYLTMSTSKLGSSWTFYKARQTGVLSVHLLSHMLYPTSAQTNAHLQEKKALSKMFKERSLDATVETKRRENAVRQLLLDSTTEDQWWLLQHHYTTTPPSPVDAIWATLCHYYEKMTSQNQLQLSAEFLRARQKVNETVAKFSARLNGMFLKLQELQNPPTKQTRMVVFLMGLLPAYGPAKLVFERDLALTQNFELMVIELTAYEKTNLDGRRSSEQFSYLQQSQQQQQQKGCNFCLKETGKTYTHKESECRRKKSGQNKHGGQHTKDKSKKEFGHSKKENVNKGKTSSKKTHYCFCCGSPSHSARECPKRVTQALSTGQEETLPAADTPTAIQFFAEMSEFSQSFTAFDCNERKTEKLGEMESSAVVVTSSSTAKFLSTTRTGELASDPEMLQHVVTPLKAENFLTCTRKSRFPTAENFAENFFPVPTTPGESKRRKNCGAANDGGKRGCSPSPARCI